MRQLIAILLVIAGSSGANAGLISGFSNGVGFTHNSTVTVSGDKAILTSGSGVSVSSSIFNNTQQGIGAFSVHYTYLATPVRLYQGQPGDGATFTIQNMGPSAIGVGGGGLGSAGISPGVAFQLNIFNLPDFSPGGAGYAINVDGATGQYGNGEPFASVAPVNLVGNPVDVAITYDGTMFNVQLTQGNNSFLTSRAIDIASLVGGGNAYVGFTAGSGSASAQQTITNFKFETVPEPTGLWILAIFGLLPLIMSPRPRRGEGVRQRRTRGM